MLKALPPSTIGARVWVSEPTAKLSGLRKEKFRETAVLIVDIAKGQGDKLRLKILQHGQDLLPGIGFKHEVYDPERMLRPQRGYDRGQAQGKGDTMSRELLKEIPNTRTGRSPV